MLAKEIGQLLEDNSIGTFGTDIFIGEFPKEDDTGDKIQSGVYLVASSGQGQDEYLNTCYDQIDFWSINPLYESGYSKLTDIRDLLSRKSNYITPNYHIYFSHDVTGIMDLDRTKDGLKLYKMTIRFIYRDINLIS